MCIGVFVCGMILSITIRTHFSIVTDEVMSRVRCNRLVRIEYRHLFVLAHALIPRLIPFWLPLTLGVERGKYRKYSRARHTIR